MLEYSFGTYYTITVKNFIRITGVHDYPGICYRILEPDEGVVAHYVCASRGGAAGVDSEFGLLAI